MRKDLIKSIIYAKYVYANFDKIKLHFIIVYYKYLYIISETKIYLLKYIIFKN